MIAAILCIIAFITTMWAGKRSLGTGLLCLLTVGYLYGITRANLPTVASHFLFDASLMGFYLSQNWSPGPREVSRAAPALTWLAVLIAWPCILSLVPFQPILVTLVGLRGNIFFLPCLMFGGRLKDQDLRLLANGLAALNLIALSVGLLELTFGVENFFPRNEVTLIIYQSNDLADSGLRIPSIFMSAHSYAGAMVVSIPLLFGLWVQRDTKRAQRYLLLMGLASALLGVLLAATRVHFAAATALVIIAACVSGFSVPKRITWVTAILIIAVITLGSEDRMKRFNTLSDAKVVNARIDSSVNQNFWDFLRQYPFGNGLGGGGTSMPYFLQNQVRGGVSEENEYARIVAEQGFIGLSLWIAFLCWALLRGTAFMSTPWRPARILAWFTCIIYLGVSFIGLGLLTAIPQSVVTLLYLGWIMTSPATKKNAPKQIGPTAVDHRRGLASILSV